MRSSVQSAPNVTPMVDVMLVLLVIFMVVAPTLLDGFRAELPRAANVLDHPNDSSDVVLGIDAAGNYFLNKRAIDSADLVPRIRALLGADPLNHVVYVKADETLDYSKVLEVMDLARQSGATVVGLITQQPPAARR
jgi:biopolymer transport protein TolR